MRRASRVMQVTVGLAMAVGVASAEIISDAFHYDGTYNPTNSPAPAGNTTWLTTQLGGLSIEPNSPSKGLAAFNDNVTNGRLTMRQNYADSGFNDTPALYEWSYTFQLQINSQSGIGSFFGMRNEGSGNGKVVWLSVQSSTGNLFWGNATANGYVTGTPIATNNLIDSTMHTYTVDKFNDAGTIKVRIFLDGVLKDTQAYSTFFPDDTSNEGFGLFGSTAGTGELIVDDVALVPGPPVSFGFEVGDPEPWTILRADTGVTTVSTQTLSGARSLLSDTTSDLGNTWRNYLRIENLEPSTTYSVQLEYGVLESASYFFLYSPSEANRHLIQWSAHPGYEGMAEAVFTTTASFDGNLILGMKQPGVIIVDNIVFTPWATEQEALDSLEAMKIARDDLLSRWVDATNIVNNIENEISSWAQALEDQISSFVGYKQIKQGLLTLGSSLSEDEDSVVNKLSWDRQMIALERDVFKLQALKDYVFVEEPSSSPPFLVFTDHALSKIRCDAGYAYDVNSRNQYDLSGATNEYESFQIVILPLSNNVNDVNIEFADLSPANSLNPHEIGKEELRWYSVEYVDTEKELYPVEYVGLWPDPLRPSESLTSNTTSIVGSDWVHPIWVTTHIPSVYGGDYSGKLRVNTDLGSWSLDLNVHVWRFGLQNQSSFKTAFRTGGADYLDTLFEHRISPQKVADPKIIQRSDNSTYVDFTDIGSLLDSYIEKGMTTLSFGPDFGRFWGWGTNTQDFTVYPEGSSTPIQLSLDVLSPEYNTFMVSYFSDWSDFLGSKGLLGMDNPYIYDEPNVYDSNEVEKVNALLANVAQADPNLSPVIPGLTHDPDSFPDLKIMCPLLSFTDTNLVEQLEQQGKEFWWYVCLNPRHPYPNFFIDYPAIDHRIIPWMAWKNNIKGLLYWNTKFWNVNPWENSETYPTVHGDGMLFYPPLESDEVIPTIRLEVIRDGIEDYDYFSILDELVDTAEQDPTFDDAALLAQARGFLEIDSNIVAEVDSYTQSPEVLLNRRAQMGQAIDALSLALADVAPASLSISDEFHYDGTYDPTGSPAPDGNTTWLKTQLGGVSIVPNSPSTGLAAFNDNVTNGRLAMRQNYADSGFNDTPALYEWSYTFQLQINSQSGIGSFFGMRNEGNGNGKAVWLSVQSSSGNLYWGNATASGYTGAPIVTNNLIDGLMHTYTVTKYQFEGTMYVQMHLDGVLKDAQAYSTFFPDDASTEGFGLFGSTGGTGDLVIDDVALHSSPPVSFGFEVGDPAPWTILGEDTGITTVSTQVLSGARSLVSDTSSTSGTWRNFLRIENLEASTTYTVQLDYRVLEPAAFFFLYSPSEANRHLLQWSAQSGYEGKAEAFFTTTATFDGNLILGMKEQGAIIIDNIVFTPWESAPAAMASLVVGVGESKIVGISPVVGGLLEIEIHTLVPEKYYLKSRSDLMEGAWINVPHSDNGIHAFIVTNLTYSTDSGMSKLIYVETDTSARFFNIGLE